MKRSWAYYLAPVLLSIIALIAGKYSLAVEIALMGLTGVWIILKAAKQLSGKYILNAEQLTIIKVSKQSIIPWDEVDTIKLRQSLLGKLFNYGDVEVLHKGREVKLFGLSYPQQIRVEWFRQAAYKNYKGETP